MNWSIIVLATLFSIFAVSNSQVFLDFQKAKNSITTTQDLSVLERTTVPTVAVDIENTGMIYLTKVTVGTPPQTIAVILDTGSSDTWVPASSATICGKNSPSGGCVGGSFNQTKSSTFFLDEPNGFNISYGDGSGAKGDYFQDTFSIGNAKVKRFQMGLAVSGFTTLGVLGIGYTALEANIDSGNGTRYPNFVDALVSAGLAPTQAYSLWLNDYDQGTGSILFGGIDTKKYHGTLISVDVEPSAKTHSVITFTVDWTYLVVKSASGSIDTSTPSGFKSPALLDSRTTITYLPNAIARLVFKEVGAIYNDTLKLYVVPCSLVSSSRSLSYGFGDINGPVITVSMAQLVISFPIETEKMPRYDNGEAACQFGIQLAHDLPTIFGNTFLRSAYVVFDLVNNKIAVANAVLNATDSHVVPFPSQGAPIPRASQASQTMVASATGSAPVGLLHPSGLSADSAMIAGPTSSSVFSGDGGSRENSPTSSRGKSVGNTVPTFDWNMLGVVIGMSLMTLTGGGFCFAL